MNAEAYEATCCNCGFIKRLSQCLSSGWKIGDVVGRAEDPDFNICNRCKYSCLTITKVPEVEVESNPTGFWKIPEE